MTDLTKLTEAIELVVADTRTENGDPNLSEREAVISARTLERDDVSGAGAVLIDAYMTVLDANFADIDAALLQREAVQ